MIKYLMNDRPVIFLVLFLISSIGLIVPGCGNGVDCIDCGGGLTDGYHYKIVSAMDLASLPEFEIESCIRFKIEPLSHDQIDPETVTVVNDCCCEEYGYE